MYNYKKSILFIKSLFFIVVLISCNKNETIVPSYIEQSHIEKEGEIKGTLEGYFEDSTSLKYSFLFNGTTNSMKNTYISAPDMLSTYQVISDTVTNIDIAKCYAGDGEQFIAGLFNFSFNVNNLKDLASPKCTYLWIRFYKKINEDKTQMLTASFQNKDAMTITNLKYDANTHILTGNYTASLTYYNKYEYLYFGKRKITNGSFSTKLSELKY